jgi:hypothetical protein
MASLFKNDAYSQQLASFHSWSIILTIRMTLTLNDAVIKRAKCYAASRSLTLGEAVTDLVQRALTAPRPTRQVNGVSVFDLPQESPRVTMKKIQELGAEQK